MDATFFDQQCEGNPAVCVWRDQLVVGWTDRLRNGAISLALGGAAAPGPFSPTIVALPFIANGDLAVASFADRIWLAYYDQAAALQITSSAGASFDPPVPLQFPRASSGVSLAAASDRLVVACIGEGNVVMVGAGNLSGVVDVPLVLDQNSDSPAVMTVISHPYYGELLLLFANWWDGAALRSAPPTMLSRLADAPVKAGALDGPSLRAACIVTPPTAPRPCVAIAGTLGDGSMGMRFFDFDRADFSAYPTLSGGSVSRSSPAIVGYQGDVLIAYVENATSKRIGIGSWGPVFGAAALQAELGQPCDPRVCTDDPRLVCVLTGETQLVQQPAQISNALAGDLVLTPADGDGVIGTILRSLQPTQFYDHMGIMVEDYTVIRHCTESKDRLMKDKSYFTGSLLGSPAPVDGLRPDLVKFGWPGPITQSVQDGFFDGWNNRRNPRWIFHKLSDPSWRWPALAFTEEQERAFFDLEHPDTPVRITNLTRVPAYREDHDGPLWPIVVRPPRDAERRFPWVRWALKRVAAAALDTDGHYRFYSYSDARIATDPAKFAPPIGDPAWAGMAAGADWAAGTPGIVCSSFVWLAATRALAELVPQLLIDRDPRTPMDESSRAQWAPIIDGLYSYHDDERVRSARGLHAWIVASVEDTVRQQTDAALPGLSRIAISAILGVLTGGVAGPVAELVMAAFAAAADSPATMADVTVGLTHMPECVANGVCNAFANDHPEHNGTGSTDWQQPGYGIAVSPDDVKLYWDAPSESADASARYGLWGSVEQALLTNSRPEVVEVGRLELSPGVAEVVGLVFFRGNAVVGAEVFIGCRKTVTDSNSTFRISVPASPIVGGKPDGDQLIRAQAYWSHPVGMLHGTLKVPLAVGLNDLLSTPIQLDPPPEWRRRVEIHGSLRMIHQVMFGHDTYDTANVSDSIWVQADPTMDTAAYRDAALAARHAPFAFRTNRCGGEIARFSGTVSLFDPGQPPPPEGPNAILVTWVYEILDGDDDSQERVDSQAGTIVVAAGQTGRLSPSLNDGDEPPDRAQSDMYIDNFTNFA